MKTMFEKPIECIFLQASLGSNIGYCLKEAENMAKNLNKLIVFRHNHRIFFCTPDGKVKDNLDKEI